MDTYMSRSQVSTFPSTTCGNDIGSSLSMAMGSPLYKSIVGRFRTRRQKHAIRLIIASVIARREAKVKNKKQRKRRRGRAVSMRIGVAVLASIVIVLSAVDAPSKRHVPSCPRSDLIQRQWREVSKLNEPNRADGGQRHLR